MEIEKKHLPANCVKEGRKKNFESKHHDLKVKSLKQRSILVCIFSNAEEEEKD